MKKIIFFFLVAVVSTSLNAQPPRPERDTLFFAGLPHQPYLNSIYDADVIEGRSVPEQITPTGQKICFDKIIKVKTVIDRGPAEVCLFINTKIGLIAYTSIKPDGIPVCDIKPDLSDFRLNIIGLKGNVYSYFNNKKKNTIEHWVQTSNSNTHQYQFTNSSANATLHKKNERRDYCDGKVKAQLYKVDGKPEEWFLFGKQYPDAVLMQPKKFLGNFAVGYQYSDKGLFIIMQMVSNTLDSKILDIQDVDICFDPSPFKVFEDEQQTKVSEDISREREKIARDEAKTEKYPSCQSKKTVLINFQKEALDRREQNLRQTKEGNMMQNAHTQQAQADLMNYDDAVQQMIYETELKLCRAEQRQENNPSESNVQEINCLREALGSQKQAKQKMELINTQFRNDPGKKMYEKSKAMLQVMKPCN